MEIVLGTIVIVITFISILSYIDYRNRLKISKKLKIGDKCRVFTSESDFKFIKIIEIHKNIATCEYDNDDIEKIKLIDLIY